MKLTWTKFDQTGGGR